MFSLGCAAFLFFFISDANDLWLRKKPLSLCFPLGAALLLLSIAWQTATGRPPLHSIPLRLCFWFLAAVFAALLVYTLFFALPAKASYAVPGALRPVKDRGVYALCRHPGVLWQALLCLCLWAASGFPLPSVLCYTALNTALVCFEDYCVFPALLSGYGEYKAAVPFLMPTPGSVRNCFAYYLRNR